MVLHQPHWFHIKINWFVHECKFLRSSQDDRSLHSLKCQLCRSRGKCFRCEGLEFMYAVGLNPNKWLKTLHHTWWVVDQMQWGYSAVGGKGGEGREALCDSRNMTSTRLTVNSEFWESLINKLLYTEKFKGRHRQKCAMRHEDNNIIVLEQKLRTYTLT